MKKKKVKTPEEVFAHEEAKRLRRLTKSLAIKVKGDCSKGNIASVKLQIEYLKNTDKPILPTELDKKQTILCFEEGLKLYLETL